MTSKDHEDPNHQVFSESWKVELFQPSELPSIFKTQILSFYRCIWPWGFQGRDQFRDWITGEADEPQHLVIHHQDTLIAALCIVRREIDFWRHPHKIAGFTGVLVYPNFQKQGVGLQLLGEAIRIAENDYDTICFHCEPEQVNFYQKAGFTPLSDLEVLEGTLENPQLSSGVMMIRSQDPEFLQKLQSSSEPLYFGPYTW